MEAALAPAEPDWEKLRDEAPDELPAQLAQWQITQKRLRQITKERETAEAELTRDFQSRQQAVIAQETERLLTAIPEWREPTRRQKDQSDLTSYAQTIGYSPEEVAAVVDSRAVVLLRKAMLYDRAKSGAKPTNGVPVSGSATIPSAPKPLKPGSSGNGRPPVSDVTRAKESHAKVQTVSSAAKVIEAMLAEQSRKAARR